MAIIAKIGPSAKPFTTVSDGEVAPEMGVMEMTRKNQMRWNDKSALKLNYGEKEKKKREMEFTESLQLISAPFPSNLLTSTKFPFLALLIVSTNRRSNLNLFGGKIRKNKEEKNGKIRK